MRVFSFKSGPIPPIRLNPQLPHLFLTERTNPNGHVISRRQPRMLRIGHDSRVIRGTLIHALLQEGPNLLGPPGLIFLGSLSARLFSGDVPLCISHVATPGLHAQARPVLVT